MIFTDPDQFVLDNIDVTSGVYANRTILQMVRDETIDADVVIKVSTGVSVALKGMEIIFYQYWVRVGSASSSYPLS